MAGEEIKPLYKNVIKIRAFEELILELFGKNKLSGTTHTYIGEEATAAAIMTMVTDEDFVFSNHRCHGHYLAYGGPAQKLLAEIMSKRSGLCEGRGGSQHIHYRNFYTNGVQGGIVPNAAGVAFANRFKGNAGNTIVFLGDGTLGQGVVYETINMALLYKCPILFVIEDNSYAMSTRREDAVFGDIKSRMSGFGLETYEITSTDADELVGFFREVFDCLNSKRLPVCAVIHNYRLGAHSKGDDTRAPEEIDVHKKSDPVRLVAERIGEEAYRRIYKEYRDEFEGFVSLLDSEESADIEVQTLPAVPDSLSQLCETAERYVDCIQASFDEELQKNENLVFIGEDIRGPYGGAFKATKGLSEKYDNRLINTPISEAGMTGMAVGMALNGMLPVVEMMFCDFITLAFDQLLNHASKYGWVYGGSVRLPLVIRVPSGAKRGYGPTHSQSLEKFLTGIPMIRVIALSCFHNPQKVYKKLFSSIKEPTIVVENKKLYAQKTQPVINGAYEDFSVREINHYGYSTVCFSMDTDSVPDVYLITYGGLAAEAVDAATELMIQEEIQADVIVLGQLSPLPLDDLKEILHRDATVLTVEEGTRTNGVGAEIIAALAEQNIGKSYHRLAAPDMPIPNGIVLESQTIPDKQKIIEKVKRICGYGR